MDGIIEEEEIDKSIVLSRDVIDYDTYDKQFNALFESPKKKKVDKGRDQKFHNEIKQNFISTKVLSLNDRTLKLYGRIKCWIQDKIRAESIMRKWNRKTTFHVFYSVENPDSIALWRKPKDLKMGYGYDKEKGCFSEIFDIDPSAKLNFVFNFYNFISVNLCGFNVMYKKCTSPNISGYKQDTLPIYYIGTFTIEFKIA